MQRTKQKPAPVVSAAEAAEYLAVDVTTVHRMIKRGELEATKLAGRTGAYVIGGAELEAFARRPRGRRRVS